MPLNARAGNFFLLLKLSVFCFIVAESLLSRIRGNSDSQSNFILILQKLPILRKLR